MYLAAQFELVGGLKRIWVSFCSFFFPPVESICHSYWNFHELHQMTPVTGHPSLPAALYFCKNWTASKVGNIFPICHEPSHSPSKGLCDGGPFIRQRGQGSQESSERGGVCRAAGERFLAGVSPRLTLELGGSEPRPGPEAEAGYRAGLLCEAGIPARGSGRGRRQAGRRQPWALGRSRRPQHAQCGRSRCSAASAAATATRAAAAAAAAAAALPCAAVTSSSYFGDPGPGHCFPAAGRVPPGRSPCRAPAPGWREPAWYREWGPERSRRQVPRAAAAPRALGRLAASAASGARLSHPALGPALLRPPSGPAALETRT